MKVEKTVTWGNIGAMVFPVGTLIVMFATMRADITSNSEDLRLHAQWHANVGEILTSHTTQLAVKDVQFTGISKSQEEIKQALGKIEEKLDNR